MKTVSKELKIKGIKNGIVIDHIKPGLCFKIFNHLKLEKSSNTIMVISNIDSSSRGRKDILKVEGDDIKVNYLELALISPNASLDIIKDEQIVEKVRLTLPDKIEGVIKCPNKRCITNDEECKNIFTKLKDRESYTCKYCDHIIDVDRGVIFIESED